MRSLNCSRSMRIEASVDIQIQRSANEKASPAELRDVAMKFEALLLNQLTSVLNTKGFGEDDGEESLFGSDGGTDLARKMFSEQLATTIAESGGFGLADVLLKQLGVEPAALNTQPKGFREAAAVSKAIRRDLPGAPVTPAEVNAAPAAGPLTLGDPSQAEVVSTFEEEARRDGIEESLRNMILDGRIVNTTRPRVAAGSPITEITEISATAAPTDAGVSYMYPVAGRMTSDFGNRVHPIDRSVKFHTGLDIAVPKGTSVEASAAGTVKFAGWSGGYGNLLVVEHADGRETRYAHLDKILVAEGDSVSAGQQVALSGNTGKSTGPHLHFEIREKGRALDPESLLIKGLR